MERTMTGFFWASAAYTLVAGAKSYELSNHLGNVMAVISDRGELQSAQDFFPFGMAMPGRSTNAKHRYGFNGKETDPETGIQDYGMRWYLPNIARFPSVDPITKDYPWYTPYQFAGNTPIQAIDLDGLEPFGAFYSQGSRPNLTREQRLTWAPDLAYELLGGNRRQEQLPSWDQLGKNVSISPPNNMININETPSAREHNERISGLSNQFHVNPAATMAEGDLVNLLLGSFFKGRAPENIIFPTDGFGSEFLRNSPQVNEALDKYATNGTLSGKASTPNLASSLGNQFTGNFKLQDFIGSVDYKMELSSDKKTLTLTMTNVTSVTSGTLGKEALPSSYWPDGIVRTAPQGTPYANFAQTFSLTFKVEAVMATHGKKAETPQTAGEAMQMHSTSN
jgi:RHS repeat-associated protein